MELSFRRELAVVVGLNEAIFLHRLDQLLATVLCIHEDGAQVGMQDSRRLAA